MDTLIKNNYREIGDRLREFAKLKFGGIKNLTDFLGMSQNSLNQYLSGRHRPGNNLLKKLDEAGCNIEWLLTGKAVVVLGEEQQNKPIVEIGEENELKTQIYQLQKIVAMLVKENEELKEDNQKLRVQYAKISAFSKEKIKG